jgi:hypothetical protein
MYPSSTWRESQNWRFSVKADAKTLASVGALMSEKKTRQAA